MPSGSDIGPYLKIEIICLQVSSCGETKYLLNDPRIRLPLRSVVRTTNFSRQQDLGSILLMSRGSDIGSYLKIEMTICFHVKIEALDKKFKNLIKVVTIKQKTKYY